MKVKDCIRACNTGLIAGLSRQVLDSLVAEKGDLLSKIDHHLIVCQGDHNNPYIQTKAYNALVRAVEARGRVLVINSCLRTPMQQWLLREQYRRGLCGITAAARPPFSNHNSALAIDTSDYRAWRATLASYSWKWLGSWDAVHFDYVGPGAVNLGRMQVLFFQKLYNKHNPKNKIAEDGIWGANTAKACANSPAQGFGVPELLRKGMFNKPVGQLQLMLRQALNLEPEELIADFKFGASTDRAVRRFQEKHGLMADGIAGSRTIAKLEEVTGKTINFPNS